MTFCIITHVQHTASEGKIFGYAPYVNEMNIWLKYTDKVIVVAPLTNYQRTAIHDYYRHDNIIFKNVPEFSLKGFSNCIKTLLRLPVIVYAIFTAMRQSDHIHLRCPGNMGLLGCLLQVFFPNKQKTAKYAGNWDPESNQPFTYRLQKWLLSNTLLSKNIRVLVYGKWPRQSKNILPFFTATYAETDKEGLSPKPLAGTLRFLFVGNLSEGKQPLYALKLVAQLKENGHDVSLYVFGEGAMQPQLQHYIETRKLQQLVFLEGNQSKQTVKAAYQNSHFLILPSKSEGWPKVVAEAMFWGCLPVASPVSCIPFMLGKGNNGILLSNNLESDIAEIEKLVQDQDIYSEKRSAAAAWSRQYTTDVFEQQISKFMQP